MKQQCDKTKELCILLDYMFSLARTPTGKTTSNVIETTRRCVAAVIRKWKDLRLSMRGPKIHLCEDHLVLQMIRWIGIGCFGEDFIEQSHQTGVMEERRTGHMSNRVRAAQSHSSSEWTRTMVQSVKTEIQRVGKESKRKRIKRKDGDTLGEINESARKKRRLEIRASVLNNISLTEVYIPDEDVAYVAGDNNDNDEEYIIATI